MPRLIAPMMPEGAAVRAARPLSPPLSRSQSRWLAAFLLCAQAPHWAQLPIWMSAAGSLLILVHFAIAPQRKISRWLLPSLAATAALGIRFHYGYFVARDPCVAFLDVLVGIKFAEARTTRDGGLLVCLGLFLTLTEFFYGQTMASAAASAPALIALGGTLAALRRSPDDREPWHRPLLRTAKMILHGLPLAALLFILFPRLAAPLWGMPADAGARTGLSDRMAPGSISELSLSDAVAFRVDFNGPPPSGPQRYWRGPVLSQFDGREWSSPPFQIERLRVLRPAGGRALSYTVTMEPSGKPWLFALEFPSSLPRAPEDGESRNLFGGELALLTRDRQLLARAPVVQALRYEESSLLRDSFPARDSERDENLVLPPTDPRTRAFARELRASVDSDAAFARAVLQWFHDQNFVYTLSPPRLQKDSIDAFLFDTRRGFCEHYASAFVVLLRAAGIPARAVTGYQGGEINPNGDYMIVRESDAHAWAEAMIGGQWQRFDPTAAVAPSRIERGIGAALPSSEPVPYLARIELTWLRSMRLHWDAVNYQWQRGVVGFNTARQREVMRDFGLDADRPWQGVAVLSLGVLLWGLVALNLARLRRLREDPASAQWQRFCTRLAAAGMARSASEGPLAYARRAAGRWPMLEQNLLRIAETYARLRYGREEAQQDEALAALRRDVAALPSARVLAARER